MKATHGRRWLSLLLAVVMCLSLAPAAWAAEGDEGENPTTPPTTETPENPPAAETPENPPAAETGFTIKTSHQGAWEVNQSDRFEAEGFPSSRRPIWESSDETVAIINDDGRVTPRKAGTTTISAYYMGSDGVTKVEAENSIEITVSGLTAEPQEVQENGTATLSVKAYGNAINYRVNYAVSSGDYFISVSGNEVSGLHIGEGRVTASAYNYYVEFKVSVIADSSTEISVGTLKNGETLPFRKLSSDFSGQVGGKVQYITGLFVPTDPGTLYYRYRSEAEPGAGVGQVESYYREPVPTGQRALDDITFVPKPGYQGGEVTITYTAVTTEGRTYACKITFTLEGGGSNSSTGSSISLNTSYNTAIKLNSSEFNQVCQELTGARLNYVTFSLPPLRQGSLYTNYSGTGDYGSAVELGRQYSLKELDNVWFVPAPGYTGEVTVYYTARATGTSGQTYTGQLIIQVESEKGSVIGGLHFETSQGGVVRFDDETFNDYCRDLLDNYQTVSFIRFDSLPSASEGTLYYDYRSASNTGSPASLDTSYFYGVRNPRIDRLVFAAAEGYVGTVRIPFTGYTTDGTRFTGNVEVNVRAGTGSGSASSSGDIRYTCAPGRSVSFNASDFNNLCREITNNGLDYIMLQGLPNSADGTLYHSGTRANASTRYYRGSSAARIGNLSFRASSGFVGAVDIPFVGRATNGDQFYGVVTIASSSSGSSSSGSSGTGSGNSGSGSTSRGNIRYVTDSQTAAVFSRDDFDDLSQWETDRFVSSVRFRVPSTSQGSLYRGYRSDSNQGTRLASTTSISASDLDRLAFVPANGFTGTVYLDFTATAAGSGGTFDGTVEVEVERPVSAVTVRYSTRTAPVSFRSSDFGRGGSSLSSIRLNSLPSTNAGYLYYQYTSPTNYGRQANTSTDYYVSGSNLISDLAFVPRAGYTGTVSMTYTGTNSNGSTFEGEVLITVTPSYNSSYFNDMGGYSDAQRAAVDFLWENGITNGISATQYGPEHSITRGDFAVMVYRAFGLSSGGSSNVFYDVPSGAYYAPAVNSLYALGIVSGVGNGSYAPQGTLSRQDAVCMVQRAMRASGWNAGDGYASVLSGYGDSGSVSGYAQGAMSNAIQVGWLPTHSGRLDPRAPLTRVDMAEMIHRVLTY